MATTTNFGWETPDDTDLVKDGALAMRTLGNAIDTSLVDLKGGTTGQVLSKTSNTDMDFTWVTSDDANAIQNAIVDAKGDLISATAADTPARLAVGNNGETLVADSSATTGLRWQGNFAAGKNKIINGDFLINQRGFSSSISGAYLFDRWNSSVVGGTCTQTAQTFTLGTAPVAGYEGRNFFQVAISGQSAAGDLYLWQQKIESVRTFANQAVTISFWAKASSGTPAIAVELQQNFGTGGSPSAIVNTGTTKQTISTSWARYTYSITVPSISGKTIGTNNDDHLALNIWLSAGSTFNSRTDSLGIQNSTFQLWGFQVEAGSVATAFQTATGTLAGELAACQRYFQILGGDNAFEYFCIGSSTTTTDASGVIPLKATMRGTPTLTFTTASNYRVTQGVTANTATVVQGDILTKNTINVQFTVASGLTAGNANRMIANNTTSATISISAEL
jgi:hypothetical protein